MNGEIHSLLAEYWRFLREQTEVNTVGDGWSEIITPYLDRHNDHIPIYVKFGKDGEIVLNDGAETLLDLEQSGCPIGKSAKRRAVLTEILNGFGIEQRNGELHTTATRDSFPQRKHALLQAILTIKDMFFMSTAVVKSLFLEDVADWLTSHGVPSLRQFNLIGKSGFNHLFNFGIPQSAQAPERLLRVINNPTRAMAQNSIMAWVDTKDIRSKGSQAYAILNDSEKPISTNVVSAFKPYDMTPLLWSQREDHLYKLTA